MRLEQIPGDYDNADQRALELLETNDYELAQYLCSQIHNGTKDLIELIESEDLINEQWYKNWKEEMRILLQEKQL